MDLLPEVFRRVCPVAAGYRTWRAHPPEGHARRLVRRGRERRPNRSRVVRLRRSSFPSCTSFVSTRSRLARAPSSSPHAADRRRETFKFALRNLQVRRTCDPCASSAETPWRRSSMTSQTTPTSWWPHRAQQRLPTRRGGGRPAPSEGFAVLSRTSLDEADRLLTLTRWDQLRAVSATGGGDATDALVFSATMPCRARGVRARGSPRAAGDSPGRGDEGIGRSQAVVHHDARRREDLRALLYILREVVPDKQQTVVFTATRHHVGHLVTVLEAEGDVLGGDGSMDLPVLVRAEAQHRKFRARRRYSSSRTSPPSHRHPSRGRGQLRAGLAPNSSSIASGASRARDERASRTLSSSRRRWGFSSDLHLSDGRSSPRR